MYSEKLIPFAYELIVIILVNINTDGAAFGWQERLFNAFFVIFKNTLQFLVSWSYFFH